MINTEAAKKMYKHMEKPPATEPRDLGREWHSDCEWFMGELQNMKTDFEGNSTLGEEPCRF